MEMHSGPKVSGRSRRVAADQGWSLRGVSLYNHTTSGTYAAVHYVLKVPSGRTFEMSVYTGNPITLSCYRNTEKGRGDLGI